MASSYKVGWRTGWRSGLAGQEACRTDVNYNVLSFGFRFVNDDANFAKPPAREKDKEVRLQVLLPVTC